MKGVVLMAERQKYLASWQSLPRSPYCRYDIKWVGCTCPWQILALILLDRSRDQEVSWYHLNQISNPTVRNITIKATGLENLYRQDDKYVSKENVLFNLQHILISIDCRSTRLSTKSSCHPSMIGIAVDWLLDVNERDTVSKWAHGLQW